MPVLDPTAHVFHPGTSSYPKLNPAAMAFAPTGSFARKGINKLEFVPGATPWNKLNPEAKVFVPASSLAHQAIEAPEFVPGAAQWSRLNPTADEFVPRAVSEALEAAKHPDEQQSALDAVLSDTICVKWRGFGGEPAKYAPAMIPAQTVEETTYQYRRLLDMLCLGNNHYNWLGSMVGIKTTTKPATSLAIIMSRPKYREDFYSDDELSKYSQVLMKNAWKYVDPVVYCGDQDTLRLRGTRLENAAIGRTTKFYSQHGHWRHDIYDDTDDAIEEDTLDTADYDPTFVVFNGVSENGGLPTPSTYKCAAPIRVAMEFKEMQQAIRGRYNILSDKGYQKTPLSRVQIINDKEEEESLLNWADEADVMVDATAQDVSDAMASIRTSLNITKAVEAVEAVESIDAIGTEVEIVPKPSTRTPSLTDDEPSDRSASTSPSPPTSDDGEEVRPQKERYELFPLSNVQFRHEIDEQHEILDRIEAEMHKSDYNDELNSTAGCIPDDAAFQFLETSPASTGKLHDLDEDQDLRQLNSSYCLRMQKLDREDVVTLSVGSSEENDLVKGCAPASLVQEYPDAFAPLALCVSTKEVAINLEPSDCPKMPVELPEEVTGIDALPLIAKLDTIMKQRMLSARKNCSGTSDIQLCSRLMHETSPREDFDKTTSFQRSRKARRSKRKSERAAVVLPEVVSTVTENLDISAYPSVLEEYRVTELYPAMEADRTDEDGDDCKADVDTQQITEAEETSIVSMTVDKDEAPVPVPFDFIDHQSISDMAEAQEVHIAELPILDIGKTSGPTIVDPNIDATMHSAKAATMPAIDNEEPAMLPCSDPPTSITADTVTIPRLPAILTQLILPSTHALQPTLSRPSTSILGLSVVLPSASSSPSATTTTTTTTRHLKPCLSPSKPGLVVSRTRRSQSSRSARSGEALTVSTIRVVKTVRFANTGPKNNAGTDADVGAGAGASASVLGRSVSRVGSAASALRRVMGSQNVEYQEIGGGQGLADVQHGGSGGVEGPEEARGKRDGEGVGDAKKGLWGRVMSWFGKAGEV